MAASPRTAQGWHMGRSWQGHALEDACPCEKAPCGLVATPDPGCPQHAPEACKTIRQAHPPEGCPGRTDE